MTAGRLVVGLAWRNVRHRPWQALLLLFSLSLATTTITLGLTLVDVGGRSWDRVSRATNGFHVKAGAEISPDMLPAQRERVRAELSRLGDAPGVIAVGGPWRQAQVDAEIHGAPVRLRVQVRDTGSAAVDQPLVTAGHWLDGREGVVLEDGFAAAAGLRPGDTITIARQRVPVRGAALTVNIGPYPTDQPAQVWISPATAARLGAALDSGAYALALRLADPDQAEAFAAAHPEVGDTWQEAKSEAVTDIEDLAAVFGILAIFVVVLTIGTAVILVAGRMAAQVRQVGTLKAVGATPGQVTCVLLVEYLAVALLATAVGLAAGTLLTPPLARLTDVLSVYGAQTPPITWPRAATAFAVTTAVVVLATVRPALRGVRRSTLRSLASNTRPPHRTGRLMRAITGLPLPLPVWLGLRAANRRRGRFLANTLGLTIGITLLITALALHTGVDAFHRQDLSLEPDAISRAADIANQDRVSSLGFTVAAFLIALALINATVAAVFAANDHARNHAIMRTIGTTPGQTVTAFLVAQLTACLLACGLGIPLGIAFYESSARGPLDPIGLSALTYIATTLTALTLYAIISAIPARLLARRPISPQLAYE
ncbi:MAG TPA: FtsX-like permease family protein [Acidimicrobiales bacterium]|nr:FtsX-like permease family protein [Acidimicrobiales bacterium]